MPYQNDEPLQEAIVNVAGTKPPYGNAKSGTVIGEDGAEYKAPTNMLGLLRVGGTYKLSYVANEFNGKTYLMVKKFSEAGGSPNQGNSNGTQARNYPQRTAANTAPPRPFIRGGAPASNDPTPERIFVCGGLNAAISSQVVNPNDVQEVVACVNALRTAWANTFAAPAIASGNRMAQSDDDMSDMIPF